LFRKTLSIITIIVVGFNCRSTKFQSERKEASHATCGGVQEGRLERIVAKAPAERTARSTEKVTGLDLAWTEPKQRGKVESKADDERDEE